MTKDIRPTLLFIIAVVSLCLAASLAFVGRGTEARLKAAQGDLAKHERALTFSRQETANARAAVSEYRARYEAAVCRARGAEPTRIEGVSFCEDRASKAITRVEPEALPGQIDD